VDQFVLHFDVSGTSRQCFKVLHDLRCLSVHFLLDLDGTIYQTLDLKERAWHATTSNSRSIGIEIANIGAYASAETGPLHEWYQRDTNGVVRIVIPARLGESGLRTPDFVPRPARPEPVVGAIQGRELAQYDFTPEQYAALTKLTATLCKVFPKLKCDYPRSADGGLIPQKLPDDELVHFQGILGHYHIQSNKVDPGPAFQWDTVVHGARKLLQRESPAVLEKPASRLMGTRPGP
jgi:N-acetylmuramoyl-L-alanine amidase